MKRGIVSFMCLLVASVTFADLDIKFQNNGTAIALTDGTTPVDVALVQLIWSATSPVAQAGADAVLGSGEFLLSDYLTAAGDAGTFSSSTVDRYNDSDVGNNDVNNGYFFVRIFDNTAKADSDWYLQFDLAGPNLKDSTAQPPPPEATYDTGNLIDSTVGGGGQFIALNDSNFGYQAIPEPAVGGLIVIFGTGMIVARRMFTKGA